jgi:hypothetical protein
MLVLYYLFVFIVIVYGDPLDDNHHSHTHHSGCGTPDQSPREFKNLKIRAKRYAKKFQLCSNKELCNGCVNINVIFHVVEDFFQKSKTFQYATDKNIAYQMEILSQHFIPTPFRFSHIKTTRMIKDEWVYGEVYYMTGSGTGDSTESAKTISASLREGGADTAN